MMSDTREGRIMYHVGIRADEASVGAGLAPPAPEPAPPAGAGQALPLRGNPGIGHYRNSFAGFAHRSSIHTVQKPVFSADGPHGSPAFQ